MFSRNRKGIQSSKYIRKKRIKIIFVAVLFVVALGSIVADVSLISKASFIQITSVRVTGTNLVSPDAVRTIVEKGLAETWWRGILSRNSIFLYPRGAIEGEIVRDFPPIAAVSFSSAGLHVLDVAVSERSPFALACSGGIDETSSSASSSSCFYMDSTGFVYAPAPQFSPGVYVTYALTSTSTDPTPAVTVGSYITDPADFAIAQQAVDNISDLGLTVIGINVPADSAGSQKDFQLFIQRPAAAPASSASTSSPTIVVYFNADQSIDTTVQYFSAFWQHETDKNFQYIDLRYGKDIVFKMD